MVGDHLMKIEQFKSNVDGYIKDLNERSEKVENLEMSRKASNEQWEDYPQKKEEFKLGLGHIQGQINKLKFESNHFVSLEDMARTCGGA